MAYQGLFTQGITVDDLLKQRRVRSQANQQKMMNDAAQGARDPQRARMGSMFGSILGRALGDNAGGADEERAELEAKNAQQQAMQQQYGQELSAGTPSSNIKFGGELIKLGYVERGGQLLQKGQADLKSETDRKAAVAKEQRRRESLVTAATNLKLTSTVELLNNGGDLDEAADQVRSQEEIRISETKGRNGKLALSAKYNKGPEWIKRVQGGEFDSMDSTLFVDMLKGVEADLKPFKTSTDATEFYRVDSSGRVFDPTTQKWVEASSLNLSVAPQLTQEVTQMDYITRTMVDTELETYGELHTQATDAQRLLELNYVSQAMVDEGIVTGKFGEMGLQARKILGSMGLSTEKQDEMVGNTEAFFKFRGRAVAEIIKAFGAGTGLSDKDREYAQGIAAGDIALEEQSINKLLELERTYANMAIAKNNAIVNKLVKLSGNDQWKNGTSFYLEAPVRPERTPQTPQVPTTIQLSPEAQAILDRIGL